MLKVFTTNNHDGSQRVVVNHDDFRHTIVLENNRPITLSTYHKGRYIQATGLNRDDAVVDIEHQEEVIKKNWDFI